MAAMLISAQAVDYDGAVLSGAKLNVYDAGTTTPRAIYASKELASGASSANPAVATATGGIAVWVDDSAGDIKITLTNSAGTTTYYSQDNIDPTNGNLVIFPLGGSDQTTGTGDSVAFANLTVGAVAFSGVTADPGADRIMFWDDSDTQVEWLSVGTGLSITGNTLSLDGDLEDISGLTPAGGAVIIGDGTDFTTESGSTLRASLGVAIGSDVLAHDANLQDFVDAFTAPTTDGTSGQFLKTDGAGVLAFATPAGGGDTLAAADETISGDWAFTGSPDFSAVPNAGKRAIVSDLGIPTFFASSYGVTATVASDQAAGIQSAIDAAEAAGGGNVVLPLGRVRIDTGLVIDSSNVVLVGAGSDGNHDVTHDDVGTILSAYGSGMTMLSVNSPSGASEYKRYGSGVRKVEFEGLGVAAKGIEIISVNGAILEDVRVTNCTTSQIATGTRTTLGEASDVQGCFWRNISLRMGDSAASQSADGLVLDGDAGAGNFSWNQIHNLTIRHYNGTGVHAINADNCRFTHVRIARPTGIGNGVIVNGRATGVKVIDNLRFLHIVSEAPILVQGTADGFAENAVGTYFLIDQSNGSATPTISPGVVCRWERGDGYLTNASFVAAAFGNSTAAAGAARSAMGSTCSAFFGNGSGNNIRLSGADGTSNVYGFNVASSGGALRLQRLAGSADFEVSFPTTVSSTRNVTGIAAVANGFSVGDSTLTSDQQMYIRGNSGHKSVLNFSDEAADFIGSVQYDHTTNTMTLRANGGSRLDVNSSKVGPVTDNALTCGSSGVRWSTSYAYVFDATTSYKVAGVKVIGAQASAIADTAAPTAYTAHASGAVTVTSNAATDLDTTAAAVATLRSEVATLTTDVNAIKAMLRTHGLIAT